MKKAIIVDLDGCLADCSARLDRAKNKETGKMDWEVFYEEMGEDLFVPSVFQLIETFRWTGHSVLILTGRPHKFRSVTTLWLVKHSVVFDELYFRSDEDRRPAPTFKKSVFQNQIQSEWDVRAAIDDDERVAQAYLELGIPCIIPCIIPGGLAHIQKSFSILDRDAVLRAAEEEAGCAVAAAILNQDGLPDNMPVGWFRDYSMGLARKVAMKARG